MSCMSHLIFLNKSIWKDDDNQIGCGTRCPSKKEKNIPCPMYDNPRCKKRMSDS